MWQPGRHASWDGASERERTAQRTWQGIGAPVAIGTTYLNVEWHTGTQTQHRKS
jgi:hypothetical protein